MTSCSSNNIILLTISPVGITTAQVNLPSRTLTITLAPAPSSSSPTSYIKTRRERSNSQPLPPPPSHPIRSSGGTATPPAYAPYESRRRKPPSPPTRSPRLSPSPPPSSSNSPDPPPLVLRKIPPRPPKKPAILSKSRGSSPTRNGGEKQEEEWIWFSVENEWAMPIAPKTRVRDLSRRYLFRFQESPSSHGKEDLWMTLNMEAVSEDDLSLFTSILEARTSFRQPQGYDGVPEILDEEFSHAMEAGGKGTVRKMQTNEEYARELRSHPKTLMLVDSETGAPIGELAAGVDINEMLGAQSLRKSRSNVSIGAASRGGDGNAEPVVVTLPSDWDPSHHPSIQVETVSHAQAKGRMGGKYDDSKVVVMSNVISRGIVLASEKLSTQMEGATNKWIDRKREEMREREANGEPPLEQSPLVFHPLAKEGVQKTYQATQQVVNFSSATISHLSTTASRFGDRVGRSLKFGDGSGSGQPNKSAGAFKSALGKTLVAIGNVADGLGTGTKNVVDAAGNSSTTIISHKYGDEAGEVARQVGGIIKGVVVVYVDARGVVRQVVLKSAGKSAIKAQMSDGRQVVLESNPNDYFDPEKQMPERNMPLKTPIKPINLVKGAMR